VFGDRGYVSQNSHFSSGLGYSTDYKTQTQHENRLLTLADKLLLRRRAIIESVIDQLKNISP